MGDLALTWNAGSADLSILDYDLESDEGLRTSCLLSLFTDRRAEEGDDLPGADDDLRGWWADEFLEHSRDKMGSKLWLLDRSKLTPDIVARAQRYASESLDWMIVDAVAKSVTVTAKIVDGYLHYLVEIERPEKGLASFKFTHVWEGEEANWGGYELPALTENRITEAGDTRITEAGDTRVLEG